MRALHESIESFLKPLQIVAETGLPTATKDGQNLFLHLFIALYVADLPETEELLCLKHVSWTLPPFHTCFAKRNRFPYSTSAKNRILRHTKSCFEQHEKIGNIRAAEDCIWTLPMIPLLPVLNSFLFIGFHPRAELYKIFRPDPMHAIYSQSVQCLNSVLLKC